MTVLDAERGFLISFDGAELGLSHWPASNEPGPLACEHVIVGIHGMNDYANAFHMAAPWWAKRGVSVYAYDQRGFGRSDARGQWPSLQLLREDLRTVTALVRERHPAAILSIVGISMGASVSITAFASDKPPQNVDRLILSGPGFRGWGSLPLIQRAALRLSSHIRPGWRVVPPRFVKIEPSDNIDMLARHSADPIPLKNNTIEQVHGVVSLMEDAHHALPKLPKDLPTLMSYGQKDIVIPSRAMKRSLRNTPPHIRQVFYPRGYHMLLRDKQAQTVFADYLGFMQNPEAELASGNPSIKAGLR